MLRVAALVLAAVAVCSAGYVDFTDSSVLCHGLIPLNASYIGSGFDESHYIKVDSVKGVKSAECLHQGHGAILQFVTSKEAQRFVYRVEAAQDHKGEDLFLTDITCNKMKSMLRIIKAHATHNKVLIMARPAGIADSFVDLDMQVSRSTDSAHVAFCAQKMGKQVVGDEHDKDFCLGLNVDHDGDCDTAKNDIDLYNWAGPGGLSVDVTCPNCFAGFSGEVFVNVVIQTTKLAKVEAGFRKLKLDSAFVVDVVATENFNVGVDKELSMVPPVTLFSFNILTVPVTFWFQVPVHALANLAVFAQGEVTAGYTQQIKWDDGLFVYWTKDHPKWDVKHHTPDKKTTPVFNASAEANANAILLLQPSVQFYLDRVFHTDLSLIPQMNANATWSSDTRQLCAGVDYEVKLQVTANFDADVSWLGIHEHKEWGPYVFYDTGDVALAQTCIPL